MTVFSIFWSKMIVVENRTSQNLRKSPVFMEVQKTLTEALRKSRKIAPNYYVTRFRLSHEPGNISLHYSTYVLRSRLGEQLRGVASMAGGGSYDTIQRRLGKKSS
jgi:hypothetical protein